MVEKGWGASAGRRRSTLTWSRNGQSTLEYVLVLAAILVAVIVMANSAIRAGVEKAMGDSSDVMKQAAGRLKSGLLR